MKKFLLLGFLVILTASFLAGCGKDKQTGKLSDYITQIDKLSVDKEIKIVGLGEATHGNSELQTLKMEVFKALVENNNCRVFAIEGDFGGSAKVNEYIMGGDGTAEEAVFEIGFNIYKTQEMADFIEWMREYNQTVQEDEKLKFYGFDMQRYDNSKELLFKYLEKVDTQLSEQYSQFFSDLNDETVYDQDIEKIKTALGRAEELIGIMNMSKKDFIARTSEKEFELALQFVQSIKENAFLQSTAENYSDTRDEYMKNKVDWILNYEGNQMIFINGHNGHIEKTSASQGFTCMGERLAQSYQEKYYAIGTDCLKTSFHAVNNAGEDKIIEVENSNALTSEFKSLEGNIFFMDLKTAQENIKLKEILDNKINMINIGAEFSEWQKKSKTLYTLELIPSQAYDAIIILKNIKPSARLDLLS